MYVYDILLPPFHPRSRVAGDAKTTAPLPARPTCAARAGALAELRAFAGPGADEPARGRSGAARGVVLWERAAGLPAGGGSGGGAGGAGRL